MSSVTHYKRNVLAFIVLMTTAPLTGVVALESLEQENEQKSLDEIANCEKRYKSENDIVKCKEEEQIANVLYVYSKYIGLEVPEIAGRYLLDKDFLDNMPRATGDINDYIALLPGVQVSESALDVKNAGEIRSQEITISGGQVWQTGYYIDGMNYNSRIDPAAYNRSINNRNDVQGGSQALNVNQQIVESIEVYDNNIPAEYGGFSSGLVKVNSLSALDKDAPQFNFSYRGSNSEWNQYNTVINDEVAMQTNGVASPPIFEKHGFDTSFKLPLSHEQALLFSINYTQSDNTVFSLGENVNTQRENINALMKYNMLNSWIDSLELSLFYAPYKNNNLRLDVLDSNFEIKGGGYGGSLNIKHGFENFEWHSNLSLSLSENSRISPEHDYMWRLSHGRDWGNRASSETEVSRQGGFGDLNKEQLAADWSNQFILDDIFYGKVTHSIKLGFNLGYKNLKRSRSKDHYAYNSAVLYTTDLNSPPLNCSGYQLDCVELSYIRPLSDLTATLGGFIDFTNPQHVIAYSNNIAMSPQYFQYRLVYPEEHIDIVTNEYSSFITNALDVGRWKFNLGFRYEYDNFFKNHNFAPRLSGSYDVFDDANSLVIFGVNRYHDVNLLSYKIKEQQVPFYAQFRPIQNSYLQGWLNTSANSNYKYRFSNLDTPYDDEVVLGWKQGHDVMGNFSIKGLYRWKKKQLSRGPFILESDGFRYAQQNNNGSGTSWRISLAWSKQWNNHSFWANTSFSETKSNANDYDAVIEQTPIDEVVYYDTENRLATLSEISRINQNFSRPIKINFGWNADWSDQIMTSLTGTYAGSYETAVTNNDFISSGVLVDCNINACNSVTIPYDVPVYYKYEKRSRLQLNSSIRWKVSTAKFGNLSIRADIQNLLNSRSFVVSPNRNGVEVGRVFWLGLSYSY